MYAHIARERMKRAERETCLFEVIIIIVNICFKIGNDFQVFFFISTFIFHCNARFLCIFFLDCIAVAVAAIMITLWCLFYFKCFSLSFFSVHFYRIHLLTENWWCWIWFFFWSFNSEVWTEGKNIQISSQYFLLNENIINENKMLDIKWIKRTQKIKNPILINLYKFTIQIKKKFFPHQKA